jgi:enediyne polyketide synthase
MGVSVPHSLFISSAHLYPLVRGRRWKSETPLRAAVSSAGFGGINTHVTLERFAGGSATAEANLDVERLLQTHQDAEVFFFSANNLAELNAQVGQVAQFAARISWAELLDLAADCARRSQFGPVRLAIVAQTPGELHDRLVQVGVRLGKALQNPNTVDQTALPEGTYLGRPRTPLRVAFMFPGQGSQRLNMGQRWRDRFASVKAHWDESDAAVATQLREPLSGYVYPPDYNETYAERARLGAVLKDTRIAQPALVAASMATADVLSYLGIEPQLVIGHSLGEYTALWQAGVLTKQETLQLAARRGASMAGAGEGQRGGMLSVGAGAEEVKRLLDSTDGYATIANLNAPNQTVVSGEVRALEHLATQCAKLGYPHTVLEVSGAFHSRMMEPARQQMADVLMSVSFSARQLPLASTVTGELVTDLTSFGDLLTNQIVTPVRFVEAMRAAQGEGVDAFIEVGPGSVLAGLARRLLSAGVLRPGTQVFATDGGSELEWEPWCHCLAYLFANGAPLNPQRVFEGRTYRAFRRPYELRFIGSPCETPTQPLSLHLRVRSSLESEAAAVAEAPVTEVAVSANRVEAAEATAENSITAEGLFVFLSSFITQRFGYPAEMVTRDTRLGEDLGLDSIKSAEVLAEALGHAKVHTDPARYMSLPLGETAAEIARLARDGTGDSRRSDAEIWASERWVRSFEVQMHESALTGETRTLPSGPVLLIDPNGGAIAATLARELGGLGLDCKVVNDLSQPPQELPQKVQGCVLVCPCDHDASPLLVDVQQMEDQVLALPRFLLEAINTALHAGLGRSGERPFFALVTRSDGLGGRGESLGLWRQAPAAAAMVKTLHLENPQVLTRVLDFDNRLSAAVVAERIIDELTCGDQFQEAGYTMSGLRYVPLLAPVPRLMLDVVSPLLNESDVVVVTGGAKGITARCVQELATGSGARWALIGSSPGPRSHDDYHGDDEISRTLAQLAAKGVTARYYACDVTHLGDVVTCIETIEKELGAITSVIHGAGVNVPHRLETLDAHQMRRVLGPKMLGLLHLLRVLDLDRLRHVTLISSVIGHSGMTGNADYAFANAWTTQLLRHIEDVHAQVTCRAFGFSVWSEIGMGARLNSVATLGRLGVQPIAPDEGARLFADLVQRMWPNVELIVAGRLGDLATARFLTSGTTSGSRWLEKVLMSQSGVELVTQVQLKPDTDPYLTDHNYEGVLLLPAVVAMEAMAHVAAACAEPFDIKGVVPRLEALKFERPIVVGPDGRTILIRALAEEPSDEGQVRVRVSVFTEIAGSQTECFSGYCVWGTPSGTWGRGAPVTSSPLPFDPAERLYGSIYFQGPMFQHIEAFHEVSERSCLARVRISRQGASATAAGPLLLDAWEVRDCFLHAIQICVPHLRLLPLSIESLETHGYPGQNVYLSARERLQEGRDYVYDIEVFDEQGAVVECISGYRCRIVDNYRNKDVLAYIRRIHGLSASLHVQARLQAEGA